MHKSYVDDVIKDMREAEKISLAVIGLLVQDSGRLLSAVDTGRLRQSIDHIIDTKNHKVTVGTGLDYSAYIEYGTKYMNAQPFLTPAFLNNIVQIRKIVEEYYGNIDKKS